MGNTFGILSLIFSLLGLCVTWLLEIFIPFGALIFPGLAIIFAIIGFIKDDSKGLSVAGLVIGIIGLICWLTFGWILIAFILVMIGLSMIPLP
ncbi:MAG: hypothetical protein ACFFKA_16575 [Candidatus Thorarchaeota archaeon]